MVYCVTNKERMQLRDVHDIFYKNCKFDNSNRFPISSVKWNVSNFWSLLWSVWGNLHASIIKSVFYIGIIFL